MPAVCEKCWADAQHINPRQVTERYRRILYERRNNPCTPEQQAGPEATVCEQCNRRTRHQVCGVCMACGAEAKL